MRSFSTTVKMSISFALLAALLSCIDTERGIKEHLIKNEWVSSKLFELPDYRDKLIFNSYTDFVFFHAPSVSEIQGKYEVFGDTIMLVFEEDSLFSADKYFVIYEEEQLRHFRTEFEQGRVIENPTSTLKYMKREKSIE